jgi:Mg2+/Co2+ transporter CorB
MLRAILDLDNMTVEDIMIPRNEVSGLDLEESIEDLMKQILSCEYTRQPVYSGDINNIIGIFHVRKANHLLRAETITHKAIKRFADEAYFIPESTKLTTQLLNFKKMRSRFAIVVDEYGEVQGLVTLEDILEEIVGDFTTNEADRVEEVIAQKNGSFLIDGTATIRDINKITHWSLPLNGPKTMNGLVLEQLESIPDGNVSFNINNFKFETVEINGNRVKKVAVTSLQSEQAVKSV